jgi:hypothetical protein
LLQGTFDILTLTELLTMLAGGNKTGTVEVEVGERSGRIHLREGLCCGVEPTPDGLESDDALGAALVELGFELARERSGEFRFLTEEPPASDLLVAVDEPIVEITRLLDEWQQIMALVPSVELCPQLAPDLPGDAITLTAAEWSLAVTLDGRVSVRELSDERAVSLLAICEEIADLVERGAVRLNEHRSFARRTRRAGNAAGSGPAGTDEHGNYEAPLVVPVAPYGPGVDEAAPSTAILSAAASDEVVGAVEVVESASAAAGLPGAESDAAIGSSPLHDPADAPVTEPVDDQVAGGPSGERDAGDREDAPGDGVEEARDRGALLRMFSALRDA